MMSPYSAIPAASYPLSGITQMLEMIVSVSTKPEIIGCNMMHPGEFSHLPAVAPYTLICRMCTTWAPWSHGLTELVLKSCACTELRTQSEWTSWIRRQIAWKASTPNISTDLNNVLVDERANTYIYTLNSIGRPSLMYRGYYSSKEGTISIIIPTALEWGVQLEQIGMIGYFLAIYSITLWLWRLI